MNSLKLRIVNPLGLHARASLHVVRVGMTFFPDADVVVIRSTAVQRSQFCHHEANAKSIMSVMMLCAPFREEIEFLSFMPREEWRLYCQALLTLHYTLLSPNDRTHAYKRMDAIDEKRAAGIEDFIAELQASKVLPDSRPFFEYVEGSADGIPLRHEDRRQNDWLLQPLTPFLRVQFPDELLRRSQCR